MTDRKTYLEQLRSALSSLAPTPFANVRQWIARARPFMRDTFPNHLSDWEKVCAEPHWISLPVVSHGGDPWSGQPGWDNFDEVDAIEKKDNAELAAQHVANILAFLDGLLDLLRFAPPRKSQPTEPLMAGTRADALELLGTSLRLARQSGPEWRVFYQHLEHFRAALPCSVPHELLEATQVLRELESDSRAYATQPATGIFRGIATQLATLLESAPFAPVRVSARHYVSFLRSCLYVDEVLPYLGEQIPLARVHTRTGLPDDVTLRCFARSLEEQLVYVTPKALGDELSFLLHDRDALEDAIHSLENRPVQQAKLHFQFSSTLQHDYRECVQGLAAKHHLGAVRAFPSPDGLSIEVEQGEDLEDDRFQDAISAFLSELPLALNAPRTQPASSNQTINQQVGPFGDNTTLNAPISVAGRDISGPDVTGSDLQALAEQLRQLSVALLEPGAAADQLVAVGPLAKAQHAATKREPTAVSAALAEIPKAVVKVLTEKAFALGLHELAPYLKLLG